MNVVQLARNVAAKIAQNSALDTLSKSLFGVGVNVFMDSLGTAETVDNEFLAENQLETIFPYVLVGGLQDDDGPVTPGDEFDVGMVAVIDASKSAAGDPENTAIPKKAQDGVFDYASGEKLGQFVEAIKTAIATGTGANLESVSTSYHNGDQYPVQHAQITLKFTIPQSF